MFPDVYVNVHVKTRNNTKFICTEQLSVEALVHILSIIKLTKLYLLFHLSRKRHDSFTANIPCREEHFYCFRKQHCSPRDK